MPTAPLFRDPVHDGATDPTIVAGPDGRWWMFYTQRRADADEPGVRWIHGTRIGVATSPDGVTWRYDGVLEGLDAGGDTHWAPEVLRDGDRYLMWLTVVPGVPSDWQASRAIVQYESPDLVHWRRIGELPLSSDRVIDACVARCGDGRWRLWYKDERADSATWAAVSDDLESWVVEGSVLTHRPHEGPNVFRLGGWFWMVVDEWRGLGVYRSTDGLAWQRQHRDDGLILHRPGSRPLDATVGRHADVVEQDDTALIVYFTHPHWDGVEIEGAAAPESRRSAVQAAVLRVVDDELVCDRDDPSPRPLLRESFQSPG